VVSETIEVMRRLWSGESVTWAGERFRLADAQLGMGPQDIPVWIAARGSQLLRRAGQVADGVVLEVKADLPAALDLVDEGAADGERRPDRIYLDRLAYRPDLYEQSASSVFVHVLMDSPTRQLRALGLDDEEIERFRMVYETGGPRAAAAHVTDDIVRKHQIVGSPEECSDVLRNLTAQLDLDVFLFYIKRPGLDENIRAIEDVHAIVERARAV